MLRAVAVAAATTTAAAAGAETSQAPVRLLDVPYVPQSVELCGGAAAAMVMRYWGETGVYAESFAHLLDAGAGGIRGEDLVRALDERGWVTSSLAGDPAFIQLHLSRGRPPVVLIEDSPGRFHYVVIVGWSGSRIVFHDPARAPFRILSESEFLEAWRRAGFWTLITLPDPAAAISRGDAPFRNPNPPEAGTPAGACGSMVAQGVRLAQAGDLNAARDLLELASTRCPGEGAAWRELAGLHVIGREWGSAAEYARRALDRDPSDAHAARILAASLFVEGNTAGALDAWNLVDEPRLDLVDVRGLERMRFGVAMRAMGLEPGSTLTSSRLERAGRRLNAVPAVRSARVTYAPAGDGVAQVSAGILERPLLPVAPLVLAATGLRAAVDREVRVDAGNPSGGGELWSLAWRWWDTRPRVAFGVAAPAPFGGTWSIEAIGERQTYGTGNGTKEESRRQVLLTVEDWLTGSLRWQAGVALERWPAGDGLTVRGGLHAAFAGDRLHVGGRAGRWSGAESTWQASSSLTWRSRTAHEGQVLVLSAGAHAAGASAPLALWAGAGTGHGRSDLLRAHPLLRDGVIHDGVFGRQLAHGTAEWRRWGRPVRGAVRLAPAVFLDLARAWRVGDVGDGRAHADVGGGIRMALPGAGVLRADVARGLRDGAMAVSVGWGP